MSANDAIFLHKDVQELFQNKTVVVLGDSIQRSVYKDLVCLCSDPLSRYVENHELKWKGEKSFRQDKLLLGGELAEKTNGTEYKEEREYRGGGTVIRYYFITRCWNDYVESIVQNHLRADAKPHVIIMNSCYWDIHRYGEVGKKLYEYNLNKFFTAISCLPSKPLLVWNSALPLADYCKGGFLRKGFNTLSRYEIDEANATAFALTKKFRFLYVDLFDSIRRHYKFTQAEDGIHWGKEAHRNMSNSILSTIYNYWGYNVIDKVPSALLPTPTVNVTPVPHPLLDWSQRYDGDHHYGGYGRYDDYSYINTPPRLNTPLLPSPLFLTPQPQLHRYHPYASPTMDGRRYSVFSMGSQTRAHRRSQTDPFPLSRQPSRQQDNNYRSRFKGTNKKTTAVSSPQSRNGSTPVMPSNSPANNTANTRSPLRECNNASVVSGADNTPLTSKQGSSAAMSDGLPSSSNQSSVDISHKCVCPENTPSSESSTSHSQTSTIPESINVASNSRDQSGEVQEDIVVSNGDLASVVNSTGKSDKAGEVGVVSSADLDSVVNSTDGSDKPGADSVVSSASLESVVHSTVKSEEAAADVKVVSLERVVNSTVKSEAGKVGVVSNANLESDVNNNERNTDESNTNESNTDESNTDVVNERKRKREKESDEEDEQQPEKFRYFWL